MATVSIRYIVDDVDAVIAFYCQQLGFREETHPLLPLPCCRAAICSWYSAHPAAARVVARPCPTAG
jgi:hypothetical protein